MSGQAVRDVVEVMIHRRRVADDADALPVEGRRGEQALGPEKRGHARDYFIPRRG
jgi:hypothetical protein